jgi:hypothetical protein
MKNVRRLLSLLLLSAAFSACSVSPTAPVTAEYGAFSPAPPPPPPPPFGGGGN